LSDKLNGGEEYHHPPLHIEERRRRSGGRRKRRWRRRRSEGKLGRSSKGVEPWLLWEEGLDDLFQGRCSPIPGEAGEDSLA